MGKGGRRGGLLLYLSGMRADLQALYAIFGIFKPLMTVTSAQRICMSGEISYLQRPFAKAVSFMQFYFRFSKLFLLQPGTKLNDCFGVSLEGLHIATTFGLLGQVVKHKLIEIVDQIFRQMGLPFQFLSNLVEISAQECEGISLSPFVDFLAIPLNNPFKTLPLIILFLLVRTNIICLLSYKIGYIFLIVEDFRLVVAVRFFGGEPDIVLVLDMQIKGGEGEVFLTAFAGEDLFSCGEFTLA